MTERRRDSSGLGLAYFTACTLGKRSTLGLTEPGQAPVLMRHKTIVSSGDTIFLEMRERAKGGERLSERRESQGSW